MKTIIHVNQQAIAANAKNGTTLPILSVWHDGIETLCSEVEISGPSRICYRPNDRLPSGASTWIETESAVTLNGVQLIYTPMRVPKEPQCP